MSTHLVTSGRLLKSKIIWCCTPWTHTWPNETSHSCTWALYFCGGYSRLTARAFFVSNNKATFVIETSTNSTIAINTLMYDLVMLLLLANLVLLLLMLLTGDAWIDRFNVHINIILKCLTSKKVLSWSLYILSYWSIISSTL